MVYDSQYRFEKRKPQRCCSKYYCGINSNDHLWLSRSYCYIRKMILTLILKT